ncbi:MAG TPA: hypothetical protein VF316_04455 [Polyangiaceae bacterium]
MRPWYCVIFVFGLAACSGKVDHVDDAGVEPGFPDTGPAWDPLEPGDASLGHRMDFAVRSCAGQPEALCHSGGAGNLHLNLFGDAGDVIGVRSFERPDLFRVAPGDPDQSYLAWKVAGDPRIDGGRMPLGATFDPRWPPLVRAWIEAGAPPP